VTNLETSPSNRADAAGQANRPVIRGTRHACVAGHYLAAHAGFAILEAGGNAVDAGVAAGIVEAVAQSEQVNFAGIAPIMLHIAATRQTVTIAGVGPWPRRASCEWLERHHGGKIPRGVFRSVVPAAPAAWLFALRRFGTMSFGEVAAAAIRLARDGFAIHPYNAEQIQRNAGEYRDWPQNAAVYLPGGQPPRAGDLFVQKDLAGTLQFLADQERAAARQGREAGLQAARDAFYAGDIAHKIVAYHRDHGGWLTAEDLAGFEVEMAPPQRGSYAGYEVCTCSFWSQGPALIQILNVLEGFDLSALGHNSEAYLHHLVEAVKLSFADRYQYYGDPQFVDVPADALLSRDYARLRRGLIAADRAWPGMPPPGDPRGNGASLAGFAPPIAAAEAKEAALGRALDTTYCCAVDRWGNVFSASPSDTSSDVPMIPGTGICPSARGTQAWGERDNVNCVAPGKRTRVTPNPVMLLKDGRPVIALRTPGGDVQPQAMAQALLNMIYFGMDPQQAVEAPRFVSWSFPNSRQPHTYHAGMLALEARIARSVGDGLAARGHKIAWWPHRTGRAGAVCVLRMLSDRPFEAAADFRRGGYALGW